MFNSYTNLPWYGDERSMTTCARGEKYSVSGIFRGHLDGIVDAPAVVVRVLVDNDANDSLNAGEGRVIARDARVRLAIPGGTAAGFDIEAYVSADNASEVYGKCVVSDDVVGFSVKYRPGSARIYNAAHTEGYPLSDDIATRTGALIGYEVMDGTLKAGFGYSAYVTFVADIIPSAP